MKPILLLAAICFATTAARATPRPLSAEVPLLIVTDGLPDDVEAMLPIADIYRVNRGRNILVITADDNPNLKADAWHNLLFFLGLTQATVVAGNANARSQISYVEDYRQVRDMQYLNLLASNAEARPRPGYEYRSTAVRFLRENPGAHVLFMANPLSFMDFAANIDPRGIGAIFMMGLWKRFGVLISSYNANVNIQATMEFLRWQRANDVPFYHLPSHLCVQLGQIAGVIGAPRRALFQNSSSVNGIFGNLLQGFNLYRDGLSHRLIGAYGIQAPHVQMWDPANEIWLGDVLLALLAIDPTLAEWESGSVEVDTRTLLPPNARLPLGYAVSATNAADTRARSSRTFDYYRAGQLLQRVYREARVTPPFSPAEDVVTEDETPIAFLGKTSYDDQRALRMLIGLHPNRLQLVIAESTHTPLTARLLREILDGSGLRRVPVLAGRAHTLAELDAIPAMQLEAHLIRSGLLSRGMLTDGERDRLMATTDTDLRAVSAEAGLREFLERNDQVDLVVTSSVDTLYAVLQTHPSLAAKIRSLHLMGGWRQARPVGDPPTEWVDGDVTRNWALSPANTASLFALLAAARVHTLVYSSHLAGGSLTDTQMPQTIAALQRIVQTSPIERRMDALRVSWNQGLREIGKPVDLQRNYGSPLALFMAAWVALGENAHRHFGGTRGTFRFSNGGTQVSFVADPASSIVLVDELERFPILDGVSRWLTERAARPRTLWERATGALHSLGNCIANVIGRRGGS